MSAAAACVHSSAERTACPTGKAGVPEQREEARERFAVLQLRLCFGEHQQVDVRLRKQFAAAVATDREQRQRRIGRDAARPARAHHGIDRLRARGQQQIDVVAAVEARRERFVGRAQSSARGWRPTRCRRPRPVRRPAAVRESQPRARSQLVVVAGQAGQDLDAVGGDRDGVLPLRGQLAVRVTTVQPSGSRRVWRVPSLIIGSIVKVMPCFSTRPSPGRP